MARAKAAEKVPEGFVQMTTPDGRKVLVDKDMPVGLVRAMWTEADWKKHRDAQERADAEALLKKEAEDKALRAKEGFVEKKPKGKKLRKKDISNKYIVILVDENPYRKKTSRRYQQFEMMMKHQRVNEFLRVGGRRGAIFRAVRKEYVELSDTQPKEEKRNEYKAPVIKADDAPARKKAKDRPARRQKRRRKTR